MMNVIEEPLEEPAMANIVYKQMPSTGTEITVCLEEDERSLNEEDEEESMLAVDLSTLVGECVSPCVENQDDDKSCLSMQSEADETHAIFSASASRVKFAPTVSHYPTMSLDEYTYDEIEESFWTPIQWKGLEKRRKKTIERLEACLEEQRSESYRGLEKLTIWGHRHTLKATNAYVNTVLNEMEKQLKENEKVTWDWEKIARLVEETTKQSAQEALEMALSDEKEARAAFQTKNIKVKKEPQPALFGYLRQVKRTSKSRKSASRLESYIQIAEGGDHRG